MGLKERIGNLEPINTGMSLVFYDGYREAQHEAAQLAAEADDVMRRMGAALAVVEPDQLNDHQRKEVSRALREYNQYKETQND